MNIFFMSIWISAAVPTKYKFIHLFYISDEWVYCASYAVPLELQKYNDDGRLFSLKNGQKTIGQDDVHIGWTTTPSAAMVIQGMEF